MATHSVFLLGKSHGQRRLAGYSLRGQMSWIQLSMQTLLIPGQPLFSPSVKLGVEEAKSKFKLVPNSASSQMSTFKYKIAPTFHSQVRHVHHRFPYKFFFVSLIGG